MPITNAQREKLCEMMYSALIEIRALSRTGKSKQAADLADTFHNLPKDIWKPDFALDQFRDFLVRVYHENYPESCTFDYLGRVNQILEMGKDCSSN